MAAKTTAPLCPVINKVEPLLIVRLVAALTGAVPKLASAEMRNVPPFIVVVPVYVLVPASVRVPEPL